MKKLVRNSAFNFGSQSATVLAALLCVPIAFRALGTERFGLLTLVWSLLSYAIVFDLGTGPAVARATAASLVHDEGRRVSAIVSAGISIQIALGITAAILIAVLAPTLVNVLNVPDTFRADGIRALYALALGLPIVLIAQSQQAVLEGFERFDLIAYIRTPVAIATYGLPAFGSVAGWSLARMIFAIVIVRACATLALYIAYRTTRPALQHGSVRDEFPGLFRYGRWLAVSGVISQLLVYLDRFLLSAMHGLTAVAQYGAPYDGASKLLALPGSIGVAMFPGLAKDAARKQIDDARTRARRATLVTLAALVPICVVLALLARPLLHFWLGPTIGADGIAAFRILMLATVLHAAAYAPVILIEAVGRSDVVARYNLIELLVYCPMLVIMIWKLGVPGAAWAWVLRNAAFMLWSVWYTRSRMTPSPSSPSPSPSPSPWGSI